MTASPMATRRSRLDFAARSLQPTQVRTGKVPGSGGLDRTAIPNSSLPCHHVQGTRQCDPGHPDYRARPSDRALLAAGQEADAVPALPPTRPAPASRPTSPAWRGTGPGDGSATAASDLMSIRQPVSRAASRAFCPSLPMASDNW